MIKMDKTVSVLPKFWYFFGVAMHGAILLSIAFVNSEVMKSGQLVPFVIISAVGAYFLYQGILYVNKHVYLTIDIDRGQVCYGNLFFNRSVPLEEVEYIRRKMFNRKIHQLHIGGKKYWVQSIIPGDISTYFKSVDTQAS